MDIEKHGEAVKDYKARHDLATEFVDYLIETRGHHYVAGYLIGELIHNKDEIRLHNLLEDAKHRDKVEKHFKELNNDKL
jgi:hypothetical protein